jgi:glycosyltransferase involved in cell wall biosynthesis
MATEAELEPYLTLKPKQVADTIYKIRIMYSGLPKGKEIAKPLLQNNKRSTAIYQSAKQIFGDDTEILYWIFKHDQLPWVHKGSNFIYEVYDDYAMNFETGEIIEDVYKGENEVLPQANHVFFTSHPLAYRKSAKTKSWSVVGNGVNYDIFAKYRISDPIDSPKRKSVGYLGNLSDFFNWELMCEVVESLPEVDFIFYGQLETEKMHKRKHFVDQLMSYDNTLFTGRVTREEGAVGINLVDVLIIPFVINDAMHAVNPLKLWEYFATGKPVVSTPMEAMKEVKEPLLRVASNTKEWINSIQTSLDEYDEYIIRKRVELARQHSWENLTKKYAQVVKQQLRNE